MSETCDISLKKVSTTMHKLVVWSNTLVLAAAAILFYNRQYIITIILLGMSITSIIYHTKFHVLFTTNTWDAIDTVSAVIGTTIVMTKLYIMFQNGQVDLTSRRNKLLLGAVIIMILVAAITFTISSSLLKGHDATITGFMAQNSLAYTQTEAQVCDIRQNEIQYQIYHMLWHIFSGLSIMGLAILIVT